MLDADLGGAGGAEPARDGQGRSIEACGGTAAVRDDDVPPPHSAAPARADGLADRFLDRDRVGDRKRRPSRRKRRDLRRIHDPGEESPAPSADDPLDAIHLDEVDAESDDQSVSPKISITCVDYRSLRT